MRMSHWFKIPLITLVTLVQFYMGIKCSVMVLIMLRVVGFTGVVLCSVILLVILSVVQCNGVGNIKCCVV